MPDQGAFRRERCGASGLHGEDCSRSLAVRPAIRTTVQPIGNSGALPDRSQRADDGPGRTLRIGWTFQPGIALRRHARRAVLLLIRSGFGTKAASIAGVLGGPRSANLRGWLASIADRHGDHTDFWNQAARRFPSDVRLIRNAVHAALRAGRTAEAEGAFIRLLESGIATATDSRFVVGLSNGDVRRGQYSRIRDRVRNFLAALPSGSHRRIAAVRLNRIIYAHFPRRAHRAADASVLRSRFVAMLARSAVAQTPRALLMRVALNEARLESEYPGSLFYTDVVQTQRDRFISLVRQKLASGEPYSFLRLGDGEAACLPYEPRLARHAAADARDRERIWWGKPLDRPIRALLAPRVARAMWDADCIGLPTIGRYLRELNLFREDSLETSLTGRGLRSVLYCSERLSQLRSPGLPRPILVSCHLHQDLALWDGYGALLDGAKELVLVSCHPDLADWMGARFGVRIAGNVVLPPDRVSGPLLKLRIPESRSLPQILDEVVDELGDLPRGRLVLVGAGYPGKWLASVARQRGGVVLDLGSVFDYWLGLNSRSYLDLAPQ